jgi:hypothetical protein
VNKAIETLEYNNGHKTVTLVRALSFSYKSISGRLVSSIIRFNFGGSLALHASPSVMLGNGLGTADGAKHELFA